MLPPEHGKAQALADDADRSLAEGEIERAESLYESAARLEEVAFRRLPRVNIRARGIIGVSLASLLYRASRYADAEAVARELLDDDSLLPSAREELMEVLAALPRSVSLASGGATLTLNGPPSQSPPSERLFAEAHDLAKSAAAAEDVEHLYLAHRTLLLYVATRKFRVPDLDAENLTQEIFLDYLRATETQPVENARGWLVAAMVHSARDYWRAQGHAGVSHEMSQTDLSNEELDALPLRITVETVMKYLPERCREVLSLHYFEGRSVHDVAKKLGTTPRYAEKLLHNCLKRARELYRDMTKL